MSRGFNFSQKKYEILGKYEFIPHIRSNYHASVPRTILDKFNITSTSVGLFKINDRLRIKKLHKEGNSLTISLKAERDAMPKITVIDVMTENELLNRNHDNFPMKQFIPKYTNSNKHSTPIYVFDYNSNLVTGGYYKKDLTLSKDVNINNQMLSSLGLYFADGGKIDASFTNSWPNSINNILELVERTFNLERKNIKVSIYCNPRLKNKKSSLEEFWTRETGVENFSKNLHLGKNSVSPQGTLEMYFCSIIVKDVILELIKNVFKFSTDKSSLIKGILSGDGSPIQQNKYCISHHIPFANLSVIDKKEFIDKAFSDFSRSIIKSKFVIYANWYENYDLLLKDVYGFNLVNRLRFAYRFINLPKTQREIVKNKELLEFKERIYCKLIKDLENHYKKLINLGLFEEKRMEKIINAYSLC